MMAFETLSQLATNTKDHEKAREIINVPFVTKILPLLFKPDTIKAVARSISLVSNIGEITAIICENAYGIIESQINALSSLFFRSFFNIACNHFVSPANFINFRSRAFCKRYSG